MAAPLEPEEETSPLEPEEEKKKDLSIRRPLTKEEKIDCLRFLHQLLKKLAGIEDPNGRTVTPCIRVELMGRMYRGLLPYQIAFLLFYSHVPIGKEISHICCHEKKSDLSITTEDRHASPCINPLHMELATKGQNAGRNDHQIAIIRYLKANRVALGKRVPKFSGPIYFKHTDASRTTGTGWTGRWMRSCCRHIVSGDSCFYNYRVYKDKHKGLEFFDEPAELTVLIVSVNDMYAKTQNDQ